MSGWFSFAVHFKRNERLALIGLILEPFPVFDCFRKLCQSNFS